MADFVFLIGPGGAGKSTVGKILAAKLGYMAIDLDDEFCERIMNIWAYIKRHGYESYLAQNAVLLPELLSEYRQNNVVFILSSGFLSTDIRSDIVENNRKVVRERGFSVLLMPSADYDEAATCIIERQLNRGLSLLREKEEQKFSQRFKEYIALGHLKVFSMEHPQRIADKIASELGRLATVS